MIRKVTFIIFLLSLLIAFFYFRPLLFKQKENPSLLDRMPEGQFLGRIKLLDIAEETSSLLYYNKIPFRDLCSPEFLLAQAKSYGLDIQTDIYFFANDSGEWGTLAKVSDSSKIISGIARLRQNSVIKDTLVGTQHVFALDKKNTYLTYGADWVFLYKGDNLPRRMYHVMYSKKNDISKNWKKFEREKEFKKEKTVVYINHPKVNEKGIDAILVAHDSDSSSVQVKTYIRSKKNLKISPKKEGLSFISNLQRDNTVHLHLNIDDLRSSPEDPYYQLMEKLGSRISFPVNSFLNAWEGDLSYHQGGFINVKEKVITSQLDEDFNVTETVTLQDKKVPAFALLLSINTNIQNLLNQLFSKGILRKENDNQLRFLFSPPLKIQQTKNFIYFYSSDVVPPTTLSSFNGGILKYEGNRFGFQIDSMNARETFGSVRIPVGYFLYKRRIF